MSDCENVLFDCLLILCFAVEMICIHFMCRHGHTLNLLCSLFFECSHRCVRLPSMMSQRNESLIMLEDKMSLYRSSSLASRDRSKSSDNRLDQEGPK